MTPVVPTQVSPGSQMMQLISSFWTPCCIYTVARLNIADLLAERPQTAEQLAERTESHAPSLYRVLRALASIGVFSENSHHQFELTTLGATLKSDAPGSMKAMALTQLGDHFKSWGNLLHSVKTGATAFDYTEGMPLWQFYETHPAEGINFMEAMTGLTGAVIMNIVPAYDFSVFDTIVDVGGGNGAMLMAILESTEHTQGTVFDEAYVLTKTKEAIRSRGLDHRCQTKAGSFFDFVPAGADGYILKMILHDWDDEKSVQILKNCCQAMTPTSKLLIMDSVIPEGNVAHPGKFMDINMMTITSGRERTEQEFSELLKQAGLTLTRVIDTQSPLFSIVEAVKIE